jgi:transcriptional regulator with XRE-family HTH domain
MKEKEEPHEFLKLVGENIAKYRKKKELSLEDLGKEIGLVRSHIHRLENGYNITLLTVLKIATVLDVPPYKLLKVDYTLDKNELGSLFMDKKSSKAKEVYPSLKKRSRAL